MSGLRVLQEQNVTDSSAICPETVKSEHHAGVIVGSGLFRSVWGKVGVNVFFNIHVELLAMVILIKAAFLLNCRC